jgi:hypothetical protein
LTASHYFGISGFKYLLLPKCILMQTVKFLGKLFSGVDRGSSVDQ